MAKEINLLASKLDFFVAEENYAALSNFILNMMMMKNIDLSPLAGKIIKMLSIPYPPCKKVIYAYLSRYCGKISDLSILATNSLLKDFKDPNPFVRRMALRLSCSAPCLQDLALQLLPQALSDTSSYLRCSAAMACCLVIGEHNVKDNQDIIDQLYAMIRDPDPSVVCACLSALNQILKSDGGVVVNSKMVLYLVGRMKDFQVWNFAAVHSVLSRHVPRDNAELLVFMNALDEKMLDSNPVNFLLAADLALTYCHKLKKTSFVKDIFKLITPQLKLLLNQSEPGVILTVLDILEKFLPRCKEHLSPLLICFFTRVSEPSAVKVRKLAILLHFVEASTVDIIADEFLMHCCHPYREISTIAVKNFTKIVPEFPVLSPKISSFIDLIDIQYNGLNEVVLSALSTMDLAQLPEVKLKLLSVISNHSRNFDSTESKITLLKFIDKYYVSESPYILERFANDEQLLADEKFASCVLTTVVDVFLRRPAEMQLILGQVLQTLRSSPSFLLKKQASVCYHLLKNVPSFRRIMRDETVT